MESAVINSCNISFQKDRNLGKSRSTYMVCNSGSRTRSASTGRDKKSDLRARYWAFLFENLQHAVDELYQTCETDENISECKEVILVLENYTREFHNLAEWFRVKWEYENTPPPQRPNSLAWEIRKSSPGKVIRKCCEPRMNGATCRELIFELDKVSKTNAANESTNVLLSNVKSELVPNCISQRIPESNIPTRVSNFIAPVAKSKSMDCACQTEDELTQTKKPISTGRRVAFGSSTYPKKTARNFSISTIFDKTTSVPPSSLSAKRASGCVSPRTPIPGRNITAPVFVPRREINSQSTKPFENKTLTVQNGLVGTKASISRSQSDSVFETLSSPKKSNEKFASVECVREVGIESCQTEPTRMVGENKVVAVPINTLETKSDSIVKNGAYTEASSDSVVPVSLDVSAASSISVMEPPANDSVEKTSDANQPKKVAHAVTSPTPETPEKPKQKVDVIENAGVANGPTVSEKSTCEHEDNVTAANLPERIGKKVETKKATPLSKSNSLGRTSVRQWDPKPQRPNVAERKTNLALRVPSSSPFARAVNQKYVKNVGVPKTGDKYEKATADRSKLHSVTKVLPASDYSNSSSKSSYLSATKSNPASQTSQPAKFPNIVRSKTAIEIKRRSNMASLPLAAPVKTGSEGRDLPPRCRRSSRDSDGWETVISRSRRSIPNSLNVKTKPFDVNKRFYEPTPSSSLPTLAVTDIKEKSPDSSKSADKSKSRNRNNSQGNSNGKESSTQSDDYNRYKRNKERPIISSTAMFTTISQTSRKKSNEKDFKKKPTKETKQRKSSNESATKKADENLIDDESMRMSKELYDKEMSLQQEINDLENADLETDADSDGTELDLEIAELCQNRHVNPNQRRELLEAKYNHVLSNMPWAEQIETLDKLEELLDRDPSGKSLRFAKNFTSLKQFEDLVARSPGRALELHQKLSSPSRKRISPDTTDLQHKAKQAKAKMNREQLRENRSAKIRELTNKIAEVRAAQATIAEEKRKSLDQKLKRAEENRNLHLKNIQEKAHDEAKKQKEIAFINELEAQNRRHDFYALCQEQEDRMQSILEERQRLREEKAAKDAAVEERRKAIEAERQEKQKELQEKMRRRNERIERKFQEKERKRIKMAREKKREDRKLALQAAEIASAEELQKKIQQKQEDSARRHEENIELIRQRAIEIGTPRLTPYQINKLCSVCNVVIDSEVFLLSHLKGTGHQEAIKKYREQFEANVKFSERSIITDAPADVLNEKKRCEKERQKMLRKRCKKIRQHLSLRSEMYFKSVSEKDQVKKIDSSIKRKISKSIKEIEKLISTQGRGIWPNSSVTTLERNLFDLVRVLEKTDKINQHTFREFDGFAVLSKIYGMALDLPKNRSPCLPLKCFVAASNVYTNACKSNVDNCLHVLLSNDIVQIVELLLNRLNLIMPNSDDRNGMVVYKADTVADVLMNLCTIILSHVTPLTETESVTTYPCGDIIQHLQDVVSYTVCTGIVDKLAVYCSSVHDDKSADSYFLLHSIELLTSLVETRKGRITDKEDCTQLMATLRATELVGAVSMLYAMLLHQDSMSSIKTQSSMVELPQDVVNVIIATLRLFSKVCELNLEFFQNVLGAEGISLQVRHIISYLLRYCVQNEGYTNLLHHVIEFIGFFAIHHHDNQMILQSGSTPTVLQQLSNLPFAYFSNPNLVRILFPTLLACCVNNSQNRTILDQEMSYQLLEDFKNSVDSKDIPLIQLLR